MDVSLGIITYKDNVRKLLESIHYQKLERIRIAEIIIVSVKSSEKYITEAMCNFKNVRILLEEKRNGKYSAVNLFLKAAKSKYLVLCSGDIELGRDAVEKMCLPMLKNDIGIVASRPVPRLNKRNKYLDYTIDLLWDVHHRVSLRNPKFGELIAFRNLKFQIPRTCVDEEMIASIISKNYKKAYEPEAIIYNEGPMLVRDYIKQRRRIYCGHLNLSKKGYIVPTLNNVAIFKMIPLNKVISLSFFYAATLELASRFFGYVDFVRGKDFSKWDTMRK